MALFYLEFFGLPVSRATLRWPARWNNYSNGNYCEYYNDYLFHKYYDNKVTNI